MWRRLDHEVNQVQPVGCEKDLIRIDSKFWYNFDIWSMMNWCHSETRSHKRGMPSLSKRFEAFWLRARGERFHEFGISRCFPQPVPRLWAVLYRLSHLDEDSWLGKNGDISFGPTHLWHSPCLFHTPRCLLPAMSKIIRIYRLSQDSVYHSSMCGGLVTFCVSQKLKNQWNQKINRYSWASTGLDILTKLSPPELCSRHPKWLQGCSMTQTPVVEQQCSVISCQRLYVFYLFFSLA